MKWLARKLLDSAMLPYVASVENALSNSLRPEPAGSRVPGKADQILLSLRYQELMRQRAPLPSFDDVGFRAYSQTDEDGILLYIFSLIGMGNRMAVEVCANSGIECNSANLIINHGWRGLLFDGDEKAIQQGRRHYAASRDTWIFPPTFVHAWVERENINDLIRDNGFGSDIDLLTIDIDGMDYWMWEAIDCCTPRVVVVECQCMFAPDAAVSVPYQRDFVYSGDHYCGASLGAFVKLGRKKGYRFVGLNSRRFNAFFVHDSVGRDVLPAVPAVDAAVRWPQESKKALELAMRHPWVDV